MPKNKTGDTIDRFTQEWTAQRPDLDFEYLATVGRQGPRADKVKELLNRVVYDYGRSEYAALARIALEQLNQQN